MGRLGARIRAVGLGLGLAVLGLELALRARDWTPRQHSPLRGFHESHPQLGWVGKRDYAARFTRAEFDVLVQHDAQGFRVPGNPAAPIDPDARRVAVLGDSFVWGWGVEQGQLFTDHLQESVGASVHIRNFGVNGYGTGQESILLREIVSPWEPDGVVVLFFGNDLIENIDPMQGRRPCSRIENGRIVDDSTRSPLIPWSEALVNHLALSDFVRFYGDVFGAWLEPHAAQPSLAAAGPTTLDPTQVQVFAHLVDRMRETCDSLPRSPELRLVYVPTAAEVVSGEPSLFVGLVHGVATDRGLPYLDLTPGLHDAWRAQPARGAGAHPLYLPRDGHWSASGHAHVARLLLREWSSWIQPASREPAPTGMDD